LAWSLKIKGRDFHPSLIYFDQKTDLSGAATRFRGVFLHVVGIFAMAGGVLVRIRGLLERVFGFAKGVLHLAFDLFGCAFDLSLGVAGPLADLPFHASRYVFHFSFCAIFVHSPSFEIQVLWMKR
jgi:hypothetical protein